MRKKILNGGKLPYKETQAAIDKLDRWNIVMNRCQVQYWLRVYEANLAQKTPRVVSVANKGTVISPLGMAGVEEHPLQPLNILDPSSAGTTMILPTRTNTELSNATSSDTRLSNATSSATESDHKTSALSKSLAGRPKGTTNT